MTYQWRGFGPPAWSWAFFHQLSAASLRLCSRGPRRPGEGPGPGSAWPAPPPPVQSVLLWQSFRHAYIHSDMHTSIHCFPQHMSHPRGKYAVTLSCCDRHSPSALGGCRLDNMLYDSQGVQLGCMATSEAVLAAGTMGVYVGWSCWYGNVTMQDEEPGHPDTSKQGKATPALQHEAPALGNDMMNP